MYISGEKSIPSIDVLVAKFVCSSHRLYSIKIICVKRYRVASPYYYSYLAFYPERMLRKMSNVLGSEWWKKNQIDQIKLIQSCSLCLSFFSFQNSTHNTICLRIWMPTPLRVINNWYFPFDTYNDQCGWCAQCRVEFSLHKYVYFFLWYFHIKHSRTSWKIFTLTFCNAPTNESWFMNHYELLSLNSNSIESIKGTVRWFWIYLWLGGQHNFILFAQILPE